MDFSVYAASDIGIKRKVNQDGLFVRKLRVHGKNAVFAVVCDGMGGLSMGEYASATVLEAFSAWMYTELPLFAGDIDERVLHSRWSDVINRSNARLREFGERRGIELGTTVTALLLTEERYNIVNVGDSRAYEIADNISQLTEDHTLVSREVSLGNLTANEALRDRRRNVLLRCVGAGSSAMPDFYAGSIRQEAVYVLCTDGFRHEITPEEIRSALGPQALSEEESLKKNTAYLIDRNKKLGEPDNISAVTIRTRPCWR
jgi:serine/threonine protein phosphatase PrpC